MAASSRGALDRVAVDEPALAAAHEPERRALREGDAVHQVRRRDVGLEALRVELPQRLDLGLRVVDGDDLVTIHTAADGAARQLVGDRHADRVVRALVASARVVGAQPPEAPAVERGGEQRTEARANTSSENVLRVRAQRRRIPAPLLHRAQAPRSDSIVVVMEQHSRLTVTHRVERSAARERHDRPPRSVRFDRREAEVLLTGQDECAAASRTAP